MKIFCFLPLFFCASLVAQVSNEKRIEFELKDEYKNETIYEFGKDGFVIFSQSTDREDKKYQWKYELFGNDLVSVKSVEVGLDSDFLLDETFVGDGKIYQLFKHRSEYAIVTIDALTLESKTITGEMESKMRISNMAIIGDYVYMTAERKGVPFVLAVDLNGSERKFFPIEIPEFKPKNIRIENMQIMKDSKEIFIFLEAVVSKKISKTYVMRLDDQGNKKELYDFSKNFTQIITSATASQIAPGKFIFTGTYSKTSRITSEGMYFALVSDGQVEKINFYNFLDLDNFLSYLPEKKQEKIEKKKEKKEKKGKELTLRYLLATHNVINTNDGYIFIGEAFYPTYRTEYYTTTSYVNGRAVTTQQSRQVFDGYQYTHAVIAKFDKNGEKVWDQSFEMWMAYKPFYVKRFIRIAEQEQNALKLVFASRSQIHSKKIDFDGKVLEDEKSEDLETGYEGDKTKGSFTNISYWYDNFFIAYGSQTIKNKTDEDVARKRTVFFINKIKFD